MDTSILEYGAPEAQRTELAGGKLVGLAAMNCAGVRVPLGFGVSATAYRRWLDGSGATPRIAEILREHAASDGSSVAAAEEAIAALLADRPMGEELSTLVRARYEQLGEALEDPDPAVAVRSSASAEDSNDLSFAGEYATYLGIRGADAVCEHVVRCWQSMFNRQAIAYARSGQLDLSTVDMAVVVQALVPATKSGVMFTLSPVTGDRSRVVIESSWGLGSAVVGGEVTPDRYAIDKASLDVLSVEVADKIVEHLSDGSVVEVDEERRGLRCLSEEELQELARIGKNLERTNGCPMDIEWAVDPRLPFPESLVLLQCRPETYWRNRPRSTVYDPATSAVGWITSSMVPRRPKP